MKIAMMGSGGVGGFFGGRLAHAGYDVSFIARGAHLAAMRERGILIENKQQGEIRVPKVRATDDPAQIGRVDLVIVSVKLWDTESAAKQIKPLVGPQTGVTSCHSPVPIGVYTRPSIPVQSAWPSGLSLAKQLGSRLPTGIFTIW